MHQSRCLFRFIFFSVNGALINSFWKFIFNPYRLFHHQESVWCTVKCYEGHYLRHFFGFFPTYFKGTKERVKVIVLFFLLAKQLFFYHLNRTMAEPYNSSASTDDFPNSAEIFFVFFIFTSTKPFHIRSQIFL
jgi:hypothetical protein